MQCQREERTTRVIAPRRHLHDMHRTVGPTSGSGSAVPYGDPVVTAPDPVLPAYGGACIDGVVRALLERRLGTPPWLPAPAVGARQVVLLTLDGLGWEQLSERAHLAPTLAGMTGGP